MYKLFLFLSIVIALQANAQQRYRVITYNVENLFDTQQSQAYADAEFTSRGSKRWGDTRYKFKLVQLGRVLHEITDDVTTPIIGIQEIENANVIHDLVSRTALADKGYSFLHRDGPDPRGIDVALLYLPSLFAPIETNYLTATYPTREVLYCKGLLAKTDTLHIFVCHLPSKRNGKKQSQHLRKEVLQQITMRCDSILNSVPKAQIIVMGDFNMHYSEAPMHQFPFVCNSHLHSNNKLFNSHTPSLSKGTYKFKGVWSCLDHILVSQSLIESTNGNINSKIYKTNFLLLEDKAFGGFKPFSTYHGPRYQGGISDHLPVYIDFEFANQ
ncbi:MAG: hypothetical protein ACRDDZ_02460 [Marinifilaceae bacterium]